ncbi:iron-sulfur cluster assembly scaffold protein [Candidatus Woesearchaeota archaeon]|jgi:NifU-like protein involved in Fe-S cluster formation|nr:iron-sulfur cluster assembly scaffold protein [Candidatus Woesearchaeota archaeon]MBT3537258.1 iron-sulfur cluster assembly scaffold protein [Candidatus Woesearchaeota archaeon]MBT4698397.1 iron-sulfur cluster assembly scaffold protein [Candidatus Woesearchaeota archaeon]MBT7106432.1 iron-sulfur cluster assembly scaffold protein [Candidatus Woesearchaeota archaeon]MBT7931193.1 iron-sulfur cluster assembly scaffold protein [Candidatus Woesearchaeota archaeon]
MYIDEYSDKVKDHFFHPKHNGKLEDADGMGKVGNPKCGDVMELFIKVEDNKISEIKFQTFGCATAIASTDALCELAKGMTLEDAEKISKQDIVDYLGGMPAIKVHCSILGEEALREAIKDYRSKGKT